MAEGQTEQWTKPQQDEFTSLYGRLAGTKYESAAKKKLFGGPQLPYEEAKGILTDLIKKSEKGQHGLEYLLGFAGAAAIAVGAVTASVYTWGLPLAVGGMHTVITALSSNSSAGYNPKHA